MQPARFLKVLVVVLGVAIVVALGFVIYGFVRLSTATDQDTPLMTATSTPPTISDLGQPVGSEIVALTALGGARLAVSVRGGGLPDRIVVLDTRNGRVSATTYASPAVAPPAP